MDIPDRIPKVTPSKQILEYVKDIPSNGYRPADSVPRIPDDDGYRAEAGLHALRGIVHASTFLAENTGNPGVYHRLTVILAELDRLILELEIDGGRR